jgi:hypothetical protein
MGVLLLVASAAFLGRPSDGQPPAARTIAVVVASPDAATPSWFHVEMTPRVGIELAPSTHSAPLRVPWDWSPESGKKRALLLAQGPRVDNYADVFGTGLRNGRKLVN